MPDLAPREAAAREAAELARYEARAEAREKANADPLPGPLLDAFLAPEAVAAGLRLQPIVAYHLVLLRALDSPLLRLLAELGKPEADRRDPDYSDDELFETLTLVQTKKMKKPMPIVLFGTEYWREVINFDALVRHGTIDASDVDLVHRTDSVDGRREFTGENMMDHLPKNEMLKLDMGNAFDLVGGTEEESLRAEIRLGRDLAAALLERVPLVEENEKDLAEVGDDKKVKELSKGMQQKAQVISTILHQPELIIVDEPFAALDPLNTRLVIDVLHELQAQGATILMSTHQMHLVEALCSRILLINQGRDVLSSITPPVEQALGGGEATPAGLEARRPGRRAEPGGRCEWKFGERGKPDRATSSRLPGRQSFRGSTRRHREVSGRRPIPAPEHVRGRRAPLPRPRAESAARSPTLMRGKAARWSSPT